MAKFGLGLCEEELGNFEKAAKIYRGIVDDMAFEGIATVDQAKQRLDTMAAYQTQVVFRTIPASVPAEPPEEKQQSQVPEANLPVR